MSATFEKAKRIFARHNGILRSSEAQKLGVHPQTLTRMLKAGLLTKEGKGFYRLTEIPVVRDIDLIQVSKRVPKAVICLISALNFHNMTTQIPRKIYIALPRETRKPRINYPPLETVWLSSKPYSSGIQRHARDGFQIPVYSKEKTVADCFKFRGKIGEDVAIEALEEYMRDRDRNIEELLKYARIDRVRTVIEPYMKALT
ncbi:MAG: type IV toxin-antitoxin system AbiEi family antitoxin domain-containing protein [Chloroflexi bacterium]|nr:type IV toxin-antitoxin system AbiEi family antitoxin domain-containing protein [Chloroflexota bacterium]